MKSSNHTQGAFRKNEAKTAGNFKRRSVHEKSCGVLAYRVTESGIKFLLLHYPGGHWDFPKGHVEKKDANEEATALRELQEETGITKVVFSPHYKESMYYEFNRGHKERVKKVVVYFLVETKEEVVNISFEHQNFVWLPYEEALERLTYENAKDLLRKAQKCLNIQP
jgi:bis(5'-nucleosidyl)-tetraphosphatase